jgi:lauroyl/myristoyl acyltransferase
MPFIAPKNIITVRDFFTFFYVFPLRKLAAILPPKVTRLMSMPLVYIYSVLPVSLQRRKSISRTLSLVFSYAKAKKDIKILTQECLRNSVYTFIDDTILNKLDKRCLIERGVIKGLENLENALSDKKGVILVGSHFTGDRVSKLFLREIGFPIMNVRSKSPVNPSTSVVEKKYFVPIMTSIVDNVLKDYVYIEDKGFSMKILKRLRENGLVSILFDARTTKNGIYCSFFGSQRFFPTNFLHIARLTGAAIVPMLCIGNSISFTIIVGKKIELQQFSDKEEFISANLNTLVKIFELQILQYPTHWLLM